MLSHRKLGRGILGAAILTLAVSLGSVSTAVAAAPTVEGVWASQVFSSSGHLQAEIDPNAVATTFHIDYITAAQYEQNVDESLDPFTGKARIPDAVEAHAGSQATPPNTPVTVLQLLFSLAPDTAYRYRVIAENADGADTSATFAFRTQAFGGASVLSDGRGWEMVSPIDKNGGRVDPPGTLVGGGVLQSSADGDSITYGSAASFAGGAAGAASASQYLAERSSGGWSTENITAPLYSASYGSGDEGVPYQLFSGDLSRALLLNGRHCRGEGTDCAVPNPPLAGTGAPAGYQNYYLRDDGGSFAALLGFSVGGLLTLEPSEFELTFAGASGDLSHVVLSSCAALSANAIEVPDGAGCDPEEQNLYLHSGGALSPVNVLPAQSQSNPGAALGAQSGAVSSDGARVYWSDASNGNLYLRSGGQTKSLDTASAFEAASSDGATAYYSKAGHLYRYDALADDSTDLTPSGGVQGVLGASADGSSVYYLTGSGLFLRDGATTTPVASSADEGNYPPATGTARVSEDGSTLLFMASDSLTGYDNKELGSGDLVSQVYRYDAVAEELLCVSCNPTQGRPAGPSSISGARANGVGPLATEAYKPRVLADGGNRIFFESADAIAQTDTNGEVDVYQWQAQGSGSCDRPEGCVSLISSGRSPEPSTFVDASEDGSDVFFLTERSLVPGDLEGSLDLYDARVGGGLPVPPPPLACDGDACQSLPPVPVNPTLTTRLAGPGNPPVRYPKQRTHCKGGFVKQKGKCVKRKRSSKRAKANRRAGR